MRSAAAPMGIADLSSVDQAKVMLGNSLLRFSAKLLRLCRELRVPVSLKNPRCSFAWRTPALIGVRTGATALHLDFCRFGEDWKKATTVLAWGCPDLQAIARRCHPHGAVCSSSGREHRRLEGKAPGGRLWTAIAEPYPLRLVQVWAACFGRPPHPRQFAGEGCG